MRFKLTRVMVYTETAEVEAEDWESANKLIFDEDVEFEKNEDDTLNDSHVENI